jgi:hypothetical protein
MRLGCIVLCVCIYLASKKNLARNTFWIVVLPYYCTHPKAQTSLFL